MSRKQKSCIWHWRIGFPLRAILPFLTHFTHCVTSLVPWLTRRRRRTTTSLLCRSTLVLLCQFHILRFMFVLLTLPLRSYRLLLHLCGLTSTSTTKSMVMFLVGRYLHDFLGTVVFGAYCVFSAVAMLIFFLQTGGYHELVEVQYFCGPRDRQIQYLWTIRPSSSILLRTTRPSSSILLWITRP